MPNTTITDILNQMNDLGVFSYVLPFLLIFALIYAILTKTNVLGKEAKGVNAIVAIAVGLLALQFDFVSIFFANIFPKFGIGLSIFLVVMIFIGFFYHKENGTWEDEVKWVGIVLAIAVVVWAVLSWNYWGDSYSNVFGWLEDYMWSLIILAGVIGAIVWAMKGENPRRAEVAEKAHEVAGG